MTGGSSPLARGLRIQFGPFMLERGIIPARAGFTARAGSPTDAARDHPRSRGVYVTRGSSPGATSGSSPLARGLLGHADAARGRLGIIPARAGFTGGLVRRPGRPGDHPRSRGVYMVAVAPRTVRPGSSPLARGLPPAGRSFSQSVRIIPARAGFTGPGRRRGRDRRDHPRSRGVYGARARGTCTERGSSPLARGLRMTAPTIPAEVRIIPARAGFTASMGVSSRE